MSLELRSLGKTGKLNADGSENLTLTISLRGFETDTELTQAYKLMQKKLITWVNKEIYGQRALDDGEVSSKKGSGKKGNKGDVE